MKHNYRNVGIEQPANTQRLSGTQQPQTRIWNGWRSLLGLGAITAGIFLIPQGVRTQETALTDATINRLTNQVVVQLQGTDVREAQLDDQLLEDDILSTGLDSRAQLIFNDDSLVRVGQNSRFQFRAANREFILEEGIAALATPRGAGGGQVRTPRVVAAVQGSFFVTVTRTIDGSTTDIFVNLYANPLILEDLDGNQIASLPPGTIALVIDGELVSVGLVDPLEFLEQSPLLSNLCGDAMTEAIQEDCQQIALVGTPDPDEVTREFLRNLGPDPFDNLEDLNDFFFERRMVQPPPTPRPTPPPTPRPTPPPTPRPTRPPRPRPTPAPTPDPEFTPPGT